MLEKITKKNGSVFEQQSNNLDRNSETVLFTECFETLLENSRLWRESFDLRSYGLLGAALI